MPRELPLLIGIGNDHRGDDAAGLLAVRAVRELTGEDGPVQIVEHRGDGASLIDLWSGRTWVILVDAIHGAGPPGRVMRFDASRGPLGAASEHGSTHAFGVTRAIELGRGLGRLPRRIELYGITGASFSMGAEAGPAVCEAARAVARTLVERLWLGSRPRNPSRVHVP